jgi:hypothetical protein
MHDIERWFYDGTLRSALSILAALLSIGAAAYTSYTVGRLTRRNPYARKKLRAEMDEWMSDIRADYAKKNRSHPSPTP